MAAFLKKYKTATLISTVVIIASILLGTGRSLRALKAEVDAAFYNGVNADSLSIQNDLNERLDLSYSLTTLAGKYLSDSSRDDVLAAREKLTNADGITDKYDANEELTDATQALISALQDVTLSEEDEKSLQRLDANLRSRNDTISHDGYNQLAEQFNTDVLGAFPANLIGRLAFVREAELFR